MVNVKMGLCVRRYWCLFFSQKHAKQWLLLSSQCSMVFIVLVVGINNRCKWTVSSQLFLETNKHQFLSDSGDQRGLAFGCTDLINIVVDAFRGNLWENFIQIICLVIDGNIKPNTLQVITFLFWSCCSNHFESLEAKYKMIFYLVIISYILVNGKVIWSTRNPILHTDTVRLLEFYWH